MILLVISVILLWLIVGVGCCIIYQILLQNGRILERLEELEEAVDDLDTVEMPQWEGLPVGSEAPPFELPDLQGHRVSLEQFQGRRVLLIFFSPQCGYCTGMAPDLAALPVDGSEGQPVPLIITSGEAEENQRLVEEYGLRCTVLLQEDREVATAYQANGTPVGYLIDEQGVLASEIAVGAQNLLALANPSDAVSGEEGEKGPDLFLGRPRRSLSESRINRDGLKAGTPAPDFRLPRLDGGELSLSEYRGQWVLLVFSDPECEPCNQLLPELERLHRSSSKLAILMVSRLSVAANRAKVAAHGLTFPVALQRSWEISRLYGKFATPIGYLIDPEGIIAADLAEGREEVLALASRARGGGDGKEVKPWQRWVGALRGQPSGESSREGSGASGQATGRKEEDVRTS